MGGGGSKPDKTLVAETEQRRREIAELRAAQVTPGRTVSEVDPYLYAPQAITAPARGRSPSTSSRTPPTVESWQS
eukprot:6579673-Lingulodinium_polyedra.AAC.1